MLYGITATSARSAWAAGCYFLGKTLILRWNGTTWKQVPSPRPPPNGGCLTAAVAASPDTAWAVGSVDGDNLGRTLMVRWNGTAWKLTS